MRGHVLALAALLLVSGAAAAQSVELAVENAPGDQQITAGDSVDLSMDLNVSVSGTTCTSEFAIPGNATIDASVQGSAPEGASNEVSGQEVTVTVPQGDHGNVEDAHQEVLSPTVSLSTSGGITEDYTVDLTVGGETAEATADPTTCEPGDFPAASDTTTVSVDVAADEEPEPEDDGSTDDGSTDGTTDDGTTDDGTTDGSTDGGTDDGTTDDGDNGIPAPGAVAALVAALGAAASRARR
jgi:hypothetical protein